ncbi:hypothetical protein D3C78_1307310 [compost metagenome]
MASAKQNAIGTPENTVTATMIRKNTTRLSLPSVANSGWASQKTPMSAAVAATVSAMWRKLDRRSRRSTANTAIRPTPTGIADARQALLISSAGVTMKASSSAYS